MWVAIVSAFKNIGALISVIRAVLDLIAQFRVIQEANRRAETEEKKQKREKAIDDSKKAETDEEIWKSQDEITRNQP